MFTDKVTIYIKAGDGGNGKVSFAHEKFKAKAGPDGGDGGRGGSVYFEVDPNLGTLSFFNSHKSLKAENGENGKNHKQTGHSGKDLVLKVPVGTIIYEDKVNKILADLSDEKEKICIAKGGEGGFGNAHFTSSTRQVPLISELGEPGEEKYLRLELKLIADVGIIGLPNVGKSTLLSVVSKAKPKIADYPFTTIVPNLGKVSGPGFDFIIADIPGLIEGASKGKGLGDEFLRHIERTRVLIHLIDGINKNLTKDIKQINSELKIFNPKLISKPQILVLGKIDVLNPKEIKKKLNQIKKIRNKGVFAISAVTHKGVNDLIYHVVQLLKKIPKKVKKAKEKPKVFTISDVVKKNVFDVKKEGNKFRVVGPKVEKFVSRTDFNNVHSVARLNDIFERMGVNKALRRLGAKAGDKIIAANRQFRFKG